MTTTYTVGLEFKPVGRGLEQAVGQVGRLEKSVNGVGRQGVGRLNTQFAALAASVGGAAFATDQFRKSITAALDRNQVTTRLRAISKEYGEFAEAQRVATRVAQTFGKSQTEAIDEVALAYGRLRPLGVSLSDIETTLRGFNTAARLSGASAAESAGAFRQLAQALGSGTLRGDELNSVLEQAPGLIKPIADELGILPGQLREFAAEGKITSDVVIAALSGIAEDGADKLAESLDTPNQKIKTLQNRFEDLQVAIGALTLPVISEAMEVLTGVVEDANGALQTHNRLLQQLKSIVEPLTRTLDGPFVDAFTTVRDALSGINSWLSRINPQWQRLLGTIRAYINLTTGNVLAVPGEIERAITGRAPGSGGGDVSPARPALNAQVPLPVEVVGGLGVGGGDRSPVRGYGFAGGARSNFTRDPDAEQTGYDVTLPGGAGGRIPNPVPELKITGTGFQGSGRGAGGRGYGGWVSGEFVGIDGKRYELFIGHFDRIDVNPGDLLTRGQTIGLQGETGRTFGAHATTHVNALQAGGNPWQVLRDEVVNPWINGFPGGAVPTNQVAQGGGLPGVGGSGFDPEQEMMMDNQALTTAAQRNTLLAQELDLLRESGIEAQRKLDLAIQLTEINQRYAAAIGDARTQEEALILLDNKKLETAVAQERAEKDILQARESGLAPLREEIGYLQARISGTEELYQRSLDIRDAMAGGASFDQASQLVGLRDQLRDAATELERADQLAQSLEQTLAFGVGSAIRGLIDGSRDLNDALADVAQQLGDILLNAALSNLFGGLIPGSALTGIIGRASGGNLTAGQPYLVGENGPELFTPGSSGTMTNSRAFGELRGTLDTFGSGAPDLSDDMGEPGPIQIDYSGAVLNFNGDQYVAREDVPRIVNQAVKQSYGYTQSRLRSRPGDRRKLGMN